MYLNLRITLKDETTRDVKAEWPDFIAFEDEFDAPITVVFDSKKVRLKHTTWLCWHNEFRNKITTKDFKEWSEEIAYCGFVPDSEVEDINPLESKARTGA